MGVHSTRLGVLDLAMHTSTPTGALPFAAGDAEWVADLLETYRAGDLDVVGVQLHEVLSLMRKAIKARQMLATVDPELLRQGFAVAAGRQDER